MEFEQIRQYLDKGLLWNHIICEELNKKHKGDVESKEVLFLSCLGRKVFMKRSYSYNVLVLVPSSAGKDHLTGSVLKLFPRDDYETYGRISAKSLNYLHSLDTEPDYSYDGKILYLKEITEEILNNEVMKEFTSGDETISQVAITKQKGGGVDVVKIKGHPVVITTTATTIPSEEIRNRFNIIKLDLSEEQTKRTFISEEEDYDPNIKSWIESLKEYKVFIPKEMMNFIVKAFPKNKIRFRRDFQRLLDFVKAVTIFNQFNRKKQDEWTLTAEPEDYDKAKDIFINAFSTCSDIPLKDIDTRIVNVLEKSEEPMSAKKILNELGGIIALQNLYPHLRNLILKEILNELTDRDSFGNVITTYVLSEEFRDKKPFVLPNYYGEPINCNNTNNGNNAYNGNNDKDTMLFLHEQNNALKPLIPLKDNDKGSYNLK